jgi:hypothetical protein
LHKRNDQYALKYVVLSFYLGGNLENKQRITMTIIIVVALLFASLALLVAIDRIVNSTLYNYGLKYDTAWASTYQIYFDGAAILIAMSIFAIILLAFPNLFEKKERGLTGLLASPKVPLEKDISVHESEPSASTPKNSEFSDETEEKESTEFLDSQESPVEKDISIEKSESPASTAKYSQLPSGKKKKESTEFWASQEIPLEKDSSVHESEPSASTPKNSELPQEMEKKELTGFWASQKLPGVFCRYCGFENEFDAVFCQKCGKSITKKNKTGASTTKDWVP